MEDTNLANKASERAKAIRKNKDFYDHESSHFTSSKDGDFNRAIENRHARKNATAMEQKVDLQCTCKSLLLRSYWHTLSPIQIDILRPQAEQMFPTSINFKRDTDSQVSYSTPALSSIVVDMSMTESQKDDELDSIKKHVKQSVFRIWKFYHEKPHSEYSDNKQTMCWLLVKCMRKKEPEKWWLEVRKTAVKALTDQRINCIKSMSTKYKCNYSHTDSNKLSNKNANNKNFFPLPKPLSPMEALVRTYYLTTRLKRFWRCAKISVSMLRSLMSLLLALFLPKIGTMIWMSVQTLQLGVSIVWYDRTTFSDIGDSCDLYVLWVFDPIVYFWTL